VRFVKRGDTQKGERQDCGTEKRTSSQHVHEIIPKEAISDCSGVSKFEALAVGPSALVFFHWLNLIVIAQRAGIRGICGIARSGVGCGW
jgi:hypothetical protein